ncbi:murein L,D-transpeptidase catalytic domain family protein [Hymenobacter sp. HD11105]|jgi:hypothetical protein
MHKPTAFASLFLTLLSIICPLEGSTAAKANGGSSSTANSTSKSTLSASRRGIYLAAFEQHTLHTYALSGLAISGLPLDVYREALLGFYQLKQRGMASAAKQTLTIIDFNRSSTQKRLWVIDVRNSKVLHHTLVAHGKNTGDEFAQAFSNRLGSEMSSLGFYVTTHTYSGKHGLSLRLRGVDPSYNTNADNRDVVVHGADYVCEEFVQRHGRLGRSQGCPALPMKESSNIIRTIKDGTVIYAHAPDGVRYESNWLKLDPALVAFAQLKGLN